MTNEPERLRGEYERSSLNDDNAELALLSAYANRQFLHTCTGTPACEGNALCAMCLDAARLTMQYVEPRLRARFIERIHHLFGYRCPVTHGSDD